MSILEPTTLGFANSSTVCTVCHSTSLMKITMDKMKIHIETCMQRLVKIPSTFTPKEIKKTYATITISSPKAAVRWYAALSPAAQIEVWHQEKNIKTHFHLQFSPLKKTARKENKTYRDRRTRRSGLQMSKKNFLSINCLFHFCVFQELSSLSLRCSERCKPRSSWRYIYNRAAIVLVGFFREREREKETTIHSSCK